MIYIYYISEYTSEEVFSKINKHVDYIIGNEIILMSEKPEIFGKKPVLQGENYYDIVNLLTVFVHTAKTFLVGEELCEKYDKFLERPDCNGADSMVGSIRL